MTASVSKNSELGIYQQWRASFFEKSISNCKAQVKLCIEKSDAIQKLIEGIESQQQSTFDVDQAVVCERCHLVSRINSGYDLDNNQVVICANKLRGQDICTSLLHELVHMYDYCRNPFDENDTEKIACSEIRAYAVAECADKKTSRLQEFFIGRKDDPESCTKRRALSSLLTTTSLNTKEAQETTAKVFKKCYSNREPVNDEVT